MVTRGAPNNWVGPQHYSQPLTDPSVGYSFLPTMSPSSYSGNLPSILGIILVGALMPPRPPTI